MQCPNCHNDMKPEGKIWLCRCGHEEPRGQIDEGSPGTQPVGYTVSLGNMEKQRNRGKTEVKVEKKERKAKSYAKKTGKKTKKRS